MGIQTEIHGYATLDENGLVNSVHLPSGRAAPVANLVADTTGLTSAQIDALYPSTPAAGTVLVDPVNNITLQRGTTKWYKSAALTLIA